MDVVERFFQVVERQGDRIAVKTRSDLTSYSDLASLVRRFGACFSREASPKVLVAYDQGPYAYAAMLGSMLTGGFYVPVNASAPQEKLSAICKLFQPQFLAGDESILEKLSAVMPEAKRVTTSEVNAFEPLCGNGARGTIAYVIFTSGSTGMPKGVVIPHTALAHYIDWVVASELFLPADSVSQYSNIAFDLSVLEIFGALCSGATLVPFTSRGERLMPAEIINEQAITVWVSVPSVISLIARAKQLTSELLAGVRRFFFCGEPLLETHVNGIFAACPDAEIWNSYGPTETTVSMTCLKLTADSYKSAIASSVALGNPIPDMDIQLVGGEQTTSGEIVILGPQLALGYWDAPEQTLRSFRELEMSGVSRRAYFTGDWAKKVNDHMFFESRVDHQVKVHGFRIELNEVAAAIRSLGWEEVVVLKLNDELTAVIEAKHGGNVGLNGSELHTQLWEKLDRYAIPSHFITLPEFPRNDNDKIDLQAVARLAAERIGRTY